MKTILEYINEATVVGPFTIAQCLWGMGEKSEFPRFHFKATSNVMRLKWNFESEDAANEFLKDKSDKLYGAKNLYPYEVDYKGTTVWTLVADNKDDLKDALKRLKQLGKSGFVQTQYKTVTVDKAIIFKEDL